MNGLDERRAEKRYRTDVPVIFQTLSGFDYLRAKELNHSNSGISFEASVALKPGAIVYISHERCPENCPKGDACESCRTTILATVKWCHENISSKMTYLGGAKYFEYGIGY